MITDITEQRPFPLANTPNTKGVSVTWDEKFPPLTDSEMSDAGPVPVSSTASVSAVGSIGRGPTVGIGGSVDPVGSFERVLTDVRDWFSRFVCVMDDLDLDLLTLWAAHTHVAFETYTTPRLVLDSSMPGSGKTTVGTAPTFVDSGS